MNYQLQLRFRCWLALLFGIWLVFSTAAAQEETRRLSLEKSEVITFNSPENPGKVVVELVNASIRVRAADRMDVHMLSRYEERARGEEVDNWSGQPRELIVEKVGNEIRIQGPKEDSEAFQYLIELKVPFRTGLTINTVNSSRVDVSGVSGDVEISTTNGAVSLGELAGSALVNTLNGPIDVIVGEMKHDTRLDVNTMNGNISLLVGTGLAANFELQTFHGEIETDIEMVSEYTEKGPGSKAVRGKRNGGGAVISASTMNGTINIREM